MCDEISVLKGKLTEYSIPEKDYADTLYQRHLFEQYKICIEMADRVSQRRNLANMLFLTLNTGVLAALATMVEKIDGGFVNLFIVLIALSGLMLSCIAWRTLIRSYRQLNTAKYKVIGAFERMLPTSPYYNAEWIALGEGKDKTKYTPLSSVESYLPVGLAIAYFIIMVVVVVDKFDVIKAFLAH